MKLYSFLKPVEKADKQYDAKREPSSHKSINVTQTLFINKRLAVVQRMWSTYTTFYERTKLHYEMYALEF